MDKYVNRFLFSFLLILVITRAAFAGPGTVFNHVVFFGDSLSDNGNLFSALFHYLPKSPPYFKGRFSNGKVWSELTADYFNEHNQIHSINYAYGGQTVIFHNPVDGYLPYTLTMAVDGYLMHSAYLDRQQTLYVMWIGSNDYLPGHLNIEDVTTKVTDKIKEIIEKLIYYGGNNFLILNLPPLDKTPYSEANNMGEFLAAVTQSHNTKLAQVILDVKARYQTVNIHLYEVNQVFDSMLHSVNQEEERINGHFINMKEPCWQGGYTFRQAHEMPFVYEELVRNLKTLPETSAGQLPATSVGQSIMQSPDLFETYMVGKLAADGKMACTMPDSYFFWDHVHPTRIVHQLFSIWVIDYINRHYQHP